MFIKNEKMKINQINNLDFFLKTLNYREIYILSNRFINNYTLEEIGKKLNITKERVRQIIKKSLYKIYNIIKNSNEGQKIIDFVKYFIIVNDEMLENKIKNIFYNLNDNDIKFLTYLIINSLLIKKRILNKKLDKNINFYYYYEFYNKMNDLINFSISSFYNDHKTKEEFKEVIKNYIISNNKFSYFYNNCFEKNFQLLIEPLYKIYISSKSMKQLIYEILKKRKEPMHFTEITIEMEKITNKPIQERYIHNILIKNKEFCWAGNGYYALEEWGYLKKTTEIIDIIIDLIRDSNRYITTDEIYEYILSKYKVNKNSIYMTLKNYEGKKIKKIGIKLWGIIDNKEKKE